MRKVISFSIFGENEKYLVGLQKNIEICKEIYHDWLVYVYYNNTVPVSFIESYKSNHNVVMKDMGQENVPGMLWRFCVDDADIFISRDADSRVSDREKLAVEEWINSGKKIHIMRDHPHHNFTILGGMWGIRLEDGIDIKKSIYDYFVNKNKGLFDRMSDMDFLRDEIYAKYINDSFVHDSFYNINDHSKPFPTPLDNYRFVGEIFEADETRNYQFNEWIKHKEKR